MSNTEWASLPRPQYDTEGVSCKHAHRHWLVLPRCRGGAALWCLTTLKCSWAQMLVISGTFLKCPSLALPWAPLACGPGGTVSHTRSSPYCPIGSFPRRASLPLYCWPPTNVCEGELIWESIFSFSLGLSSSVDNDKSSTILTLHIPPGLKSGHWGPETWCCVFSDNVNLLAKGFEKQRFSYLPLFTWTCTVS